MGISDVQPVCEPRQLTDVIGPDAMEYYMATRRMGDAPDNGFTEWLKQEPRTWGQALDKFLSGGLGEGATGSTMRALSIAALRENAYDVFLSELATRCKDAGTLKVDVKTAEGVISSWQR